MKAAIITFYYNSNNYGGNLQAFALVKTLQTISDIDVEQIQYKSSKPFSILLRKKLSYLYHRFIKDRKDMKNLVKRNKIISKFNASISHNKNIYTASSVKKIINEYDLFVAGSDQIWNPKWSDEIYRLDFIPNSKYKISYAASLGVSKLNEKDKAIFQNSLSSFKAVSVREKDSVELLSPLSPVDVKWLLDPTLLLSSKQWDEICSPRKYDYDYIFTYFLGDSIEQRNLVIEFARKNNLKIVTLPYACGYCDDCDKSFGDIKEFSSSPADFISLIKNAKYVFTDSFHASVFSILYRKDFFAFQRPGMEDMSSRLYSLTELFELQDRFCNSPLKTSLKYIESLTSINYDKEFTLFNTMKEMSINFLAESINDLQNKS